MVRYYYPESLSEALRIRSGESVIPLAGGTDLMVRFGNWSGLEPSFSSDVMGISHLKELRYIKTEGGELAIGAGMTLNELADYPELPELLKLAVKEIAAPAIRNLATLAGNIANASPAADSVPPLAVMNAVVQLVSLRGERRCLLEDFITGPGRTVLAGDELIESIRLPLDFIRREKEGVGFFRKVGTRKANALSKLSCCAWGLLQDGIVQDIRLCAGGVAPVVVRLPEHEKLMQGLPAEELLSVWGNLRDAYGKRITPLDDQRSTASYRKKTALKLLDYMVEEISSS